MCRPKFRNALPDVPFAPKFLALPSSAARFCQFTPQALEKAYRWEPHAEPTLGVHIDLVDPENAMPPVPQPPLPLEDRRLLQDDGAAAAGAAGAAAAGSSSSSSSGGSGSGGGGARAKPKVGRNFEGLRPNVTWLKKTIYLGNDLYKAEHSFSLGIKERAEDKAELQDALEDAVLTPNQALAKVKESFRVVSTAAGKAAAGQALKHATKPGLTAVEVWPVLPSFEHFPLKFTQVDFDSDPTVLDRSEKKRQGAGGAAGAAAAAEARAAKRRRVMSSVVRNSYEEPREGRLIGSFMLPREDPADAAGAAAGAAAAGGVAAAAAEAAAGGVVLDWQHEFELSIRTTKEERQDQSFVFLLEEGGDAMRFFKSASRLQLKRSRVPLGEDRKGSVILASRPLTHDERLERHDVLTHLDRNLEMDEVEEEEEQEQEEQEQEQEQEQGEEHDEGEGEGGGEQQQGGVEEQAQEQVQEQEQKQGEGQAGTEEAGAEAEAATGDNADAAMAEPEEKGALVDAAAGAAAEVAENVDAVVTEGKAEQKQEGGAAE
jgi:hypothetical protein